MIMNKIIHQSRKGVALCALLGLLLGSASVYAQDAASTTTIANDRVTLEQNTAEVINLGGQATEVFVANPEIADVQLNNQKVAYVFAKKPGETTVFATNADGKVMVKMQLRVVHNLKQLNQTLASLFPGEEVKTLSTPAGIIMSGRVTSPLASKNIHDVITRYVGEKELVVNNLTVASPTQVYLKVKIAEVNRTVLNKLDINWGAMVNAPANFTYGLMTGRVPFVGNALQRSAALPQLGSYGAQFADGHSTYSVLLDALDKEGLGTILAEPTLIAVSGETASFLAGGEFPYPVPQDRNITIEFKQFGISLAFTPTVMANNKIALRVRPEVSELDNQNAINIPVGNGVVLNVPGIKTRRADTSVELGSGQSLAIAGLISSATANSFGELPGVADIPVIGALFRSTEFRKNQTELVITVTPYIVEPTSDRNALRLPTDNLRPASNIEMWLLQRLNRPVAKGAVPSKNRSVRLYGPAGFNMI